MSTTKNAEAQGEVAVAPARDGKPKKEKREKVARVTYPGPKLESPDVPTDFDPKAHKPLKKSNFANEHTFMRFKANQLEQLATKIRKDADEIEALGGGSAGSKAKKMKAMLEKMKELAGSLGEGEDGIDLAKVLGDDIAKALLG